MSTGVTTLKAFRVLTFASLNVAAAVFAADGHGAAAPETAAADSHNAGKDWDPVHGSVRDEDVFVGGILSDPPVASSKTGLASVRA